MVDAATGRDEALNELLHSQQFSITRNFYLYAIGRSMGDFMKLGNVDRRVQVGSSVVFALHMLALFALNIHNRVV
jgi:hypothetical protein